VLKIQICSFCVKRLVHNLEDLPQKFDPVRATPAATTHRWILLEELKIIVAAA